MPDVRIPFHRELRTALERQIAEEARAVLEGKSASYEDYRYRVGRLKAYHEVLAIAEEIEKKLVGDR